MLKLYKFVFFSMLILVMTLSLLPLDSDFISTGWDKSNHLLAFFVLSALYDSAYPLVTYWRCKLTVLVCFGLLIEVLQSFTTYRFFSWLDLVADAVAIFMFYPFRSIWLSTLRSIEARLDKSL